MLLAADHWCALVIAGPGEHRDPHRIAQLVQQHGVTTLHFVPPLLRCSSTSR
jgi:non-ribosomal peptide synthetase component F